MLSLLEDGVRFVMPADTASRAVKRLLAEFWVCVDVVDRVHDGHAYQVWETEFAIVPDLSRRRYVFSSLTVLRVSPPKTL